MLLLAFVQFMVGSKLEVIPGVFWLMADRVCHQKLVHLCKVKSHVRVCVFE